MSSNGKNPSKYLQWHLECLGHSLIEIAARHLPGPYAFKLGEMLAGLAWYLMPKRRRLVMRNLRIAFAGEKDLAELHRMARETFCRTGGNLISAAHTSRLSPAQLAQVLEIKNLHLLEQAIAKNKGVVILLSHMGNWELLSRIIHFFPKGSKAGAFYRPLNNTILDQRVLARRQADGTRMFSKGDNPLHVAAFLKDGGIVGILADQRVGPKGELSPFFGRLTRVSPLPSLLARRAKAETLALSMTSISAGKWSAEFLPVDEPHSTRDCMVALEKAMKRAPVDVFWFQERWKVNFRGGLTIRGWLGESGRFDKPHRALLWLVHAPATWSLPETWQHPDVIYEVALADSQQAPSFLSSDARIHRVAVSNHQDALRQALKSIDTANALPLDYILAPAAPKALLKAAVIEQIPLVDVKSASHP